MIALVYIFNSEQLASVFLNLSCMMILISRKFLQFQNSAIEINSMSSIFIYDVRNVKSSTEFVIFKLYFSVTLNKNLILVQIQIEIHVVDDFKINLLLSINNMISEKIIIDLAWKQAIFRLCKNVIVKLNIIFKSNHQATYLIYSNVKVVVLSHSEIRISI